MDNAGKLIPELLKGLLYLSKSFYMDCEDGQGFSEAIDKARGDE